MQTIENLLASEQEKNSAARSRKAYYLNESVRIHDAAKNAGRGLTSDEQAQYANLRKQIDAATAELAEINGRLDNIKRIKAEEDANDLASRTVDPNYSVGAKGNGHEYRAVVTSEARTYSRENDLKGNGTAFITDVIGAYRGNPQANERLARHMREYEVDNNGRQTRAAGDVTTGALPNLVVPSYLVGEYAAKPSAARPFADVMRHVDLPAEGMKVELATGNTSATAALQTSELVAAGGGNYDANPLELSVQTAEAWQLVSRQAIDRGRVTENVVMGDMFDQLGALIDSTVITQGTTGLYDSGTRITFDSASPTVAELYPLILQGASKVAQTLLNRGKPTHVLMHPRRWYWLQSTLTSTWPWMSQPGVPPQNFGTNNGVGYDGGVAGRLPCGLDVILDANVQTAALAGAQTGGTQDILYVVAGQECVLLEPPTREVFIRAEAPTAPQLGVMLVLYEYFSYSFSRYAATSVQRINGTGTVPPAGF